MMDYFLPWLSRYGYVAVFIGCGLDHSGVSWPLVAAAFWAASGRMHIAPLVLAAAAGVVVFDHLLYGVGWFFSTPLLRRLRFGGKWTHLVDSTELAFRNHGPGIVVWGRFVATIGRMTPLFAGTFRVPYQLFLPYTIIGTAITMFVFGYLPYTVGRPLMGLLSAVDKGAELLFVVVCVLPVILVLRTARRRDG